MNMRQLKTKWADNINEKNVLGEYPRPLMRRKSYAVSYTHLTLPTIA